MRNPTSDARHHHKTLHQQARRSLKNEPASAERERKKCVAHLFCTRIRPLVEREKKKTEHRDALVKITGPMKRNGARYRYPVYGSDPVPPLSGAHEKTGPFFEGNSRFFIGCFDIIVSVLRTMPGDATIPVSAGKTLNVQPFFGRPHAVLTASFFRN